MKSTYHLAALLLAAATPLGALAQNHRAKADLSTSTSTSTTTSATSTVTAGSTSNSEKSTSSTSSSGSKDTSCSGGFALNIVGDLSSMTYATSGGPWPVSNGKLSSKSSFCFSGYGSGGKMSIGVETDYTGNSLIECNYPAPGGSQGPGCDISLVDGFSVPITCTLASGNWINHGSNSLGCAVDILSECTGSDATYDSAAKVCHNPTGAKSDESLTTKPWSNCKEGSSEVWYGDQGYYEFDASTGFPVTCTIGSASPPSKRDLGMEEPVAEALEVREMRAVHKHGAAGHSKRTRGRALGLANIIGRGKL